LEYCRKATTIFAKAMKETGAHCTSIGDGYASPDLISPETYNEFVLGHHQKLTKEVQDHGIPLSIHVCGDTTSIIEDLGKTGASILEMDWKLDFKNAFNLIPSNCTLMGNINPSDLVFASPEKIFSDTLQLLKNTTGQNLILSSGCALGRNTKPENVEAMIKAARNFHG
jgi:MtaA/CmuA family methyltransferase